MRRWLILLHRYLGIALSALFVLWFASGLAMMYAGEMPNLAPARRLERAADLDLAAVQVTPADAARRLRLVDPPTAIILTTVLDRPAYRFFEGQTMRTVFADTGAVLVSLSMDECRRLATRMARAPEAAVEYVATLTRPDQWTLVDRRMPVHKFRVHDADGTEVYVAPHLGEVTVMTTRRARLLAWLGAIPHWLYLPSLRLNRPLWYQLVVWASLAGCVMTVLGLMIGVLQLRVSAAGERRVWIPYTGWMRWHHLTGLAFGLFALTWIFSGLLSMEPFNWTRASGLELRTEHLAGGPPDPAAFPPLDAARWSGLGLGAIKQIEFRRVLGDPYYLVTAAPAPVTSPARTGRARTDGADGSHRTRWLVEARSLRPRIDPFGPDSIVPRVAAAAPGVPVTEVQRLTEYDRYYYARYGRVPPLPVLRIKLGDGASSWVYLDPQFAEVVFVTSRFERLERWLYHGLHSLDVFAPYESAWRKSLVILLSLGGLGTSGLGLWLGWKRVWRWATRQRR